VRNRPRGRVRQIAKLLDLKEAASAEAHRLRIDDLRNPFRRQSSQQRRPFGGKSGLDNRAVELDAAVEERGACERLLDGPTVVLSHTREEGREIEERRAAG
jgi:hypothetical protein